MLAECWPIEFVASATVPLAELAPDGLNPEPPSVALQLATANGSLRITRLAGQVIATIWGAFLSTLLPLIGPAVELFPALSKTVLESVDALFVSVPAATL